MKGRVLNEMEWVRRSGSGRTRWDRGWACASLILETRRDRVEVNVLDELKCVLVVRDGAEDAASVED